MSEEPKIGTVEWNTRNWIRQRDELQALAEKRFWKLVPDENGSWFEVQDQLGRTLYGPAHFPALRGFFAGQLPQA